MRYVVTLVSAEGGSRSDSSDQAPQWPSAFCLRDAPWSILMFKRWTKRLHAKLRRSRGGQNRPEAIPPPRTSRSHLEFRSRRPGNGRRVTLARIGYKSNRLERKPPAETAGGRDCQPAYVALLKLRELRNVTRRQPGSCAGRGRQLTGCLRRRPGSCQPDAPGTSAR